MTARRFRVVPIRSQVDARGSLVVAQEDDPVPFKIRRMFAITGVPADLSRGAHAHREQEQFLIMLSGSCSITVDDGATSERIDMTSSTMALYAPPLHWLDLEHFSADAVCCVLASGLYDAQEYIRDHAEFLRLVNSRNTDTESSASERA